MMIVLTGIVHVSRMGRTSLFLHSVLRGNAGLEAMSSISSATPTYISDWEAGADGSRFTADDQPLRNGTVLPTTLGMITDYSAKSPNDWSYVAGGSRLPVSMANLRNSYGVVDLLGFARAQETLHVPVDPVIRQLIYAKDEVAIKEEVWMPLMGGLY